jgi:hypothetical protein
MSNGEVRGVKEGRKEKKMPPSPELGLDALGGLKPRRMLKLRFCYKNHSRSIPLSLRLLCFFITFFLFSDIGTAPQTTRPLYNNIERRTHGNSLLLTFLSTFHSP